MRGRAYKASLPLRSVRRRHSRELDAKAPPRRQSSPDPAHRLQISGWSYVVSASLKRGARRGATVVLAGCPDQLLVTAELVSAQRMDLASVIAPPGGRQVDEPDRCVRHLAGVARAHAARHEDAAVFESDPQLVALQLLSIG